MDDIDKEFREYIEHRTRYAFDVAARKYPGLIDFGNGFLELLQAQWAREFWFNKCMEK
jgi:hypothetical protein